MSEATPGMITSIELPVAGINYHTKSNPDKNPYNLFYPPHEKKLTDEGIRKELTLIKDGLHCDSVRIVGHWDEELLKTGRIAEEVGLQAWYSPRFANANFDETRRLLEQFCATGVARGAEDAPLIVANELPYDCSDITGTDIANYDERVKNYIENYLKKGRRLNNTDRVKELIETARKSGWKGTLSYASMQDEDIDWDEIEDENLVVGVNLYWGKNFKTGQPWTDAEYDQELKRIIGNAGGRKVVVTEFGAVPQQNGLEKGGGGWHHEDPLDYDAQAQAFEKYLTALKRNGVGYFAYSFSEPKPNKPHQNFGLVLQDLQGENLQLSPAAEIFSRFNQQALSPHGSILIE